MSLSPKVTLTPIFQQSYKTIIGCVCSIPRASRSIVSLTSVADDILVQLEGFTQYQSPVQNADCLITEFLDNGASRKAYGGLY